MINNECGQLLRIWFSFITAKTIKFLEINKLILKILNGTNITTHNSILLIKTSTLPLLVHALAPHVHKSLLAITARNTSASSATYSILRTKVIARISARKEYFTIVARGAVLNRQTLLPHAVISGIAETIFVQWHIADHHLLAKAVCALITPPPTRVLWTIMHFFAVLFLVNARALDLHLAIGAIAA